MSKNAPIKARLFIGGLKSLFIDMATTIEEIEKTGQMPMDLLESFEDVKTAIDIAVLQLKKTSELSRCCSHAPEIVQSDDEDDEDDDEQEYCEGCDEPCEDCSCEEEQDEEEEEELPPPPPSKVKKQQNKVVIPAKKKGK